MVVNITKISQRTENKSLLSIEKNIKEWEKMFYYHYKKLLFWKNNEKYKDVLKNLSTCESTLASSFKWKKKMEIINQKNYKKIKTIYKTR